MRVPRNGFYKYNTFVFHIQYILFNLFLVDYHARYAVFLTTALSKDGDHIVENTTFDGLLSFVCSVCCVKCITAHM